MYSEQLLQPTQEGTLHIITSEINGILLTISKPIENLLNLTQLTKFNYQLWKIVLFIW